MSKGRHRGLSQATLVGFAISCSGGPIALATISLIQSTQLPPQLRGLLTAGGAVLFFAPLAVWLEYSREVSSPGGLYSFVREAVGQPTALIHGLAWSLSYLLYLAFTCAYIVYFLLPEMLPVSKGAQEAAEVGLPLILSCAVTFAGRGTVRMLAAFGAIQLLIVALFGVLVISSRPAAPAEAIGLTTGAGAASSIGAISLLFVCSSLVLYLGGEVHRGRRALRRSLVWAYASVAVVSIFVSVAVGPWIDQQVNASAVPGYAIAFRIGGRRLALAVGLLTLASLVGLVLAEFIALARLWRSMFRWSDRNAGVTIGVLFVLLDVASLADPFRFYNLTIGPSLAALFVAQLIVFAVFPFFRMKRGSFRLVDALLAAIAVAWSLYGIYLALSPAPAY